MQKVHVLESCDNIRYMHVTLDPCLLLELDEKKMHLGYFCGTVQRPIFVIEQASTSNIDMSVSSNFDFVNPCVHRF